MEVTPRPNVTAISDLPTELITAIVAQLDDDDVFAFRLTNKSLERSTFSFWAHRYFRKKGFMLTSTSLSVLISIANHRDLSRHVQHIWFNPDCYTFVQPKCGPVDDEIDDPNWSDSIVGIYYPKNAVQYAAYLACMQDHNELLANSACRLEAMLSEALPKLPKLLTVGMRRSEDHRPWGWRTLREAIGEDPRVLGDIPRGPQSGLSAATKLFMAIINAAAAKDVRLRRFYTDAIEIDHIRPRLLSDETLGKACQSIWYLELNASKTWLNKEHDQNCTALSNSSGYGNNLCRLLRATTQLKEIGLQIFPDRKQSHIVPPTHYQPESWRTSYPYLCLDRVAASVRLEHLTRVKLEKLTTSPSTLCAILAPCQSMLSSLKIRDVRLLSDQGQDRPWEPFFVMLRDSCSNLVYLLLHHLMYDHGSVAFGPDQSSQTAQPAEGRVVRLMPVMDEGYNLLSANYTRTKYMQIAVEIMGEEDVRKHVKRLVDEHIYRNPVHTDAMEEAVWHTDTSDEEW